MPPDVPLPGMGSITGVGPVGKRVIGVPCGLPNMRRRRFLGALLGSGPSSSMMMSGLAGPEAKDAQLKKHKYI